MTLLVPRFVKSSVLIGVCASLGVLACSAAKGPAIRRRLGVVRRGARALTS
jgi:hypothetical protein